MKVFRWEATPEQTLGIPYGPNSGYGAGHPNIGYIDLREAPERIDELPELQGFPELKELVQFLSQRSSAFVTLRIDSGYDFFEREGFTNSCFTLLTLAVFRLHPVQDRKVFDLLMDEFQPDLRANSFSEIGFRISPLEVSAISSTCLDVLIKGYGFSRVAARRAWKKPFELVDQHLRDFHSRLVNHDYDDVISGEE